MLTGLVLSVHLIILAPWIFVVNGKWAYQVGVSYTERLFEVLDSMLDEKT